MTASLRKTRNFFPKYDLRYAYRQASSKIESSGRAQCLSRSSFCRGHQKVGCNRVPHTSVSHFRATHTQTWLFPSFMTQSVIRFLSLSLALAFRKNILLLCLFFFCLLTRYERPMAREEEAFISPRLTILDCIIESLCVVVASLFLYLSL